MPMLQPVEHSESGSGPIFLLGNELGQVRPRVPFDAQVLGLLAELSARLRKHAEARSMPDVQTFAFWCRKANLQKLKAAHDDHKARLGLGLVFHVAPGNVPINFAFSLAFGLLAGNTNVVRVPSRQMAQVDVVLSVLGDLLAEPDFASLAEMIALVRYPAGDAFTADISARANGRVIWGGDETVAEIRKLPLPPRAREVTFADRYSFCVMDAAAMLAADDKALGRLAEGFYNDTYLMDQNACSSPHLVVWKGAGKLASVARKRFWDRLQPIVGDRYPIPAVNAVDKYTDLLVEAASDDGAILNINRWRNDIHTVELSCLPDDLETLRGRFGLFHEFTTMALSDLVPLINGRFQTLTYYGIDKAELQDFIIGNGLTGIDRAVPIGQALDMDTLWDGYDLIHTLSRIIDLR
ncbi:MAG: acyl-CoA reductase [Hirschia sp.]|mgnify:CR=1 FL=1|nr:acyl-CoA reductase [Hirschia sp.]MBF19806.1 acyl-CoA reductase [Hirschia sp.]